MFELKSLDKEFVPDAIKRAKQYRLLNEPQQAESICLDVLDVDPNHQGALVVLILAMTDQFGLSQSPKVEKIKKEIARFKEDYEKKYYTGIVCERMGRSTLAKGLPGADYDAYDWLREAMQWYEEAEKIKPSKNDHSILRWNTCARTIMRHNLKERPKEEFAPIIGD